MSDKINHGGPAFPPSNPGYAHGMTLRDYFAARAMQGLLANGDADADMDDWDWPDAVANNAYAMADAMLRAREAT